MRPVAGGFPEPVAPPARRRARRDLRDEESLRLGCLAAILGTAFINAIYVYGLLLRATRGTGSSGTGITLVVCGSIAAVVFASIAFVVSGAAAWRHVRWGNWTGIVVFVAGLLVAFLTPAALVVALGQASSVFWWAAYLAFLPASLLLGAQAAHLEPARGVEGWLVRPLLLAGPAIVGAVGPVVSMLALFFSFRFESATGAGLALSGMGLGFNAAIALEGTAERRRRMAVWVPSQPRA